MWGQLGCQMVDTLVERLDVAPWDVLLQRIIVKGAFQVIPSAVGTSWQARVALDTISSKKRCRGEASP
ncbi:hypothetical protein DPV78_004214 [Talaromyces pinophilus]|nr:hypothetical protein DPV78_004214 [Talaromyces pinophilus]